MKKTLSIFVLLAFIFRLSAYGQFTFTNTGNNVGIGTSTPTAKLEIVHSGIALKFSRPGYTTYSILQSASNGLSIFNDATNKISMYFASNGDINVLGKLSIGNVSTPGNYSLYVEKGILAEKVRVALKSSSDWADYVFKKDYKLMPLTELEAYIQTNQHLPNIPAAEQVKKEGIDLAEMNIKLLEKIEELTLHIIEQQKQIDALKKEFLLKLSKD